MFPSHIFWEQIGTPSFGGQFPFAVGAHGGGVCGRAAGAALTGSAGGHHGAQEQAKTEQEEVLSHGSSCWRRKQGIHKFQLPGGEYKNQRLNG